jgi:hypothetical protein
LNVPTDTVSINHFTEEDSAAVTELRRKVPELVAGISHSNGLCRIRNAVAGQKLNSVRAGEVIRVEAEL